MLNNNLLDASWEKAILHAQNILPGVCIGFNQINPTAAKSTLSPENILDWPFSIWCQEIEAWGTSNAAIRSNILGSKRVQYIDIRDSGIDTGYNDVPSFNGEQKTNTLCQHAVLELDYLQSLWKVMPPRSRKFKTIEKSAIKSVFVNKERALMRDWLVVIDHLSNERANEFLDMVIPAPEKYLDMRLNHED